MTGLTGSQGARSSGSPMSRHAAQVAMSIGPIGEMLAFFEYAAAPSWAADVARCHPNGYRTLTC
jgi:hypothetical protein